MLLTTSCNKKPWLIENVTWYSLNPEIIIVDSYGYIKHGDDFIETSVWWSPSNKMGIYEKTNEEGHSQEDDLLSGSISFDGEKITLKVQVDKVFNYEYETIVLYKREMNDEDKEFLSSCVQDYSESSAFSSLN